MKPHILIIGNGVAGVTVARQLRKKGVTDPILIISGETTHHFSRTALMYIFMGHLNFTDTQPYADDFWQKNKIELKQDWVTGIDPEAKQVSLANGEVIDYSELVIATGSKSNFFGWPGQNLPGVQGLYTIQDVELLEKNVKVTQHAVICGGGLIGVEMAEMLLSRGVQVTFLVREKAFWNKVLPREESEMVARLMNAHHINLRLETELDSIQEGADGRVVGVLTKSGDKIPCQLVAMTVGVSPNIDWLRETPGLDLDRGVLIDSHFKTSLDHVWSVGDCAQFRDPLSGRRPIEQVWYTGKMQGEFLAANMAGDVIAYSPGMWWNSAKFFDVEYQTYGVVLPNPPVGEASFYWEEPETNRSLRINYQKESMAVCGVNIMGMRHRHEVWESWITSGTPITEVLSNLVAANFDPEFFQKHESSIIAHWNALHSDQPEWTIALNASKGLFSHFFRQQKRQTN